MRSDLELTIKAVLIGLLLSLVFCGTNIYLGLNIGNTISASIPAAILAMGILRLFKNYTVLENSISQTTASVGEGLASGIIFVFPAFLILKVSHTFNYFEILSVLVPGSLVGVVYSTILRGVLLGDTQLKFPEGIAVAKVLESTCYDKTTTKKGVVLAFGMLLSSIVSFCQIGLQLISSGYKFAFSWLGGLFGGGISFSSAMLGAGYLIGVGPMLTGFVSAVAAWFVAVPIFSIHNVLPHSLSMTQNAFHIWSTYVRPIGIGVFIFTGFAMSIRLIVPISRGLSDSIKAIKIAAHNNQLQDLNLKLLLFILLLSSIPVVFVVFNKIHHLNGFTTTTNVAVSIFITFILLILGFSIAAVSGYFAGIAGSTSSPVSGLLFIAVIIVTLVLKLFTSSSFTQHHSLIFIDLILLLVGFICGTAVITNGSVQDFKSGQVVGSSPYKQQIALLIGVIFCSIFAPLFIDLIYNAYGIAGIVPRPGMDLSRTLSAPQATAVANLTQNIITNNHEWKLLLYGILIGIMATIIDLIGEYTKKYRISLISVGMGFYLPPGILVTLFLGSCLRYFIDSKSVSESNKDTINLFICGIIAGESLMGLILAVPFIIYKSSTVLMIHNVNYFVSMGLAVLTFFTIITIVLRLSNKK